MSFSVYSDCLQFLLTVFHSFYHASLFTFIWLNLLLSIKFDTLVKFTPLSILLSLMLLMKL